MIFHSKIYIANRVIPHFLIRTLNCLHLSAIKYTNIFLNNIIIMRENTQI